MIKIVATFQVRKESVEEVIALAQELVDITRTEAGCAQYDVAQSTESPQEIVVLESWESKEALDAHSASEHFTRLVPAIAQLCEEPPTIQTFTQII